MRQRPRPSPRRGLIRAALVIICLVALLLAALLVVSSLTASTVKAPVVPPSPSTVSPAPTARTVPIKPKTTRTTKHKDVAARLLGAPRGVAGWGRMQSPAAAPHRPALAFFGATGDPYALSPLFLREGQKRAARRIGAGDALVRPAWSPDDRRLLYVRAQQISALPGARWTVVEYDTRTASTRVLTSVNAMNVAPLGWSMGQPIFLVSNATDSSIYTASEGHRRLMGILMPQPFTTAFLSPDGRYIAVAAPTNCSFCTLDVYNMRTVVLSTGPTGVPDERDIAWSADGHYLAVRVRDRIEVALPDGRVVHTYPVPPGLPRVWRNVFRLRMGRTATILVDSVARRAFTLDDAAPLTA